MTPTPEGILSTSGIWKGEDAINNQTVEETAQDNTTSEEAVDSTSTVVESDSK